METPLVNCIKPNINTGSEIKGYYQCDSSINSFKVIQLVVNSLKSHQKERSKKEKNDHPQSNKQLKNNIYNREAKLLFKNTGFKKVVNKQM